MVLILSMSKTLFSRDTHYTPPIYQNILIIIPWKNPKAYIIAIFKPINVIIKRHLK